MRTLYHFRFSPFSRRVRLALAHKKLEVEMREGRADPANIEEARKLAPVRTLPVYVDEGRVLSDSNAILHWLDSAYPQAPRLWPDGQHAATALQAAALTDVVLDNVIDVGTRYWPLRDHPSWTTVRDEMLGRARSAADALAGMLTSETIAGPWPSRPAMVTPRREAVPRRTMCRAMDSLRTVIGTTLVIGGVLTGILVLRESRFAPEWLRPPPAESSDGANVGPGAPALPPAQPPAATATIPPPPTAAAPSDTAPASAATAAGATPEPSASAPQPVASATAGTARKPVAPSAAQPGEPEVVELPSDFRYSPQGAGNLTFPVAPATASTSTGQAR